MADKINGCGRVGLDTGTVRTQGIRRSDAEGKANESRGARPAADAVELTDTAHRLKSIEARLARLPDVDQSRVNELRQRIESGQYRPDPARIAAKLMRMERDLA